MPFSFDFSWEHIAATLLVPGCILLVSLLAGIVLNNFVNQRIRSHVSVPDDSFSAVLIGAMRGVPLVWCFGVGLYWTINTLDLSPKLAYLLSCILFTLIVFSLTRVIARALAGMVDIRVQRSQAGAKNTLLTNIVNLIVYAMGFLVILEYYGISIAPLVTALGIGGMAVALGLQETLANIFSGLHLILSKQLRLGDYIRLSSGEEGRVTGITWRFTTILGTTGNDIVIPNQKIASAILTNYNMPQQSVAIVIPVGVSYDSDLDAVERVTLEVAREVTSRIDPASTDEPAVRFNAFADSSINFSVILHASQFPIQPLLKHEFIKALTHRYRAEGIEIPFPVRTIIQEGPK